MHIASKQYIEHYHTIKVYWFALQKKLFDYYKNMIAILKTYIFQLLCILLFSILYWINSDGFQSEFANRRKQKITYLDHLFTAVTVQATVGYSELYPINTTAKILLMMQQFIMISSNILILYLFSIHLSKGRN